MALTAQALDPPRVVAGAVAALLLLVACGDGASPTAAPTAPPARTSTTAPPASPTTSPTATSTTPPSTAPAVPSTPSTVPSPTPPATSRSPSPAPSPSVAVPAWCRGRDLEVLATDRRVAALTVDMGGNSAGLDSILRTLEAAGVRATFFVTGAWSRHDEPGLRRIVAAGHVVGNHTDTHPHLTGLSDADVRAELAALEQRVLAVTGRTTRPLFRFPFGDRDERTLAVVNDAGWCAYRWTVDTLGWQGTSGGRTEQTVLDRVAAALRPGAIVLMHGGGHPDDGSTLDADALPEVLRLLQDRGYRTTTLPG